MEIWTKLLTETAPLVAVLLAFGYGVFSLFNRFLDNVVTPESKRRIEFMASLEDSQKEQNIVSNKISDTLRVLESNQKDHIAICREHA